MNNLILKTTLMTSLFCLGVVAIPAHAAKSKGVGKAIISIGKVFSTNKAGVESKLKRRGKVFEGDTIKVGKKSRLQLRFVDNQLVVLKANTVFRIDEYKFKDKNDQNKSAALSLLKGGMRSVTGLIGKSARDKYKVKTPVATMGVRGTHYVLQLCAPGACGNGSEQGLYGTVVEGAIEMQNDGGSVVFGKDAFFHVPSNDETPKGITNPPSSLTDRSETQKDDDDKDGDGKDGDGKDGDGKDGDGTSGDGTSGDGTSGDGTGGDGTGGDGTGDGTGDDSLPPPPGGDGSGDGSSPPPTGDGTGSFSTGEQTTVETTTGTVNTTSTQTFIAGTPASFGSTLVIAGIIDEPDGAGGVVGIEGLNSATDLATVNGVGNQPVDVFVSDMMGSAEFAVIEGAVSIPADTGGDPMLGINWGRWASNDIVFKDAGVEKTLLTGLAFIYSPNTTTPTELASLGAGMQTATYSLSMASPVLRDELGNAVSGPIGFSVDFNTELLTNFTATLSGGGRNYSITQDNTVETFADVQLGIPITASCGGCPGGITTLTGDAGGTFIGPNAEGFAGYVGVTATDGMGNNIGVSGVGVFDGVLGGGP